MGALRRWLDRLTETDEARLADGDPRVGGHRAGHGADRRTRRSASACGSPGIIRRMTVFPMQDDESLEAHVSDGTGEVVVRFMGRRAIRGLGLGTKVVVEGVLGEQHGATPLMINPRLEFTE